MVFESVVVDVLNRFLGDYVVNLDSSQLQLGIWGGKPEAKLVPGRIGAELGLARQPAPLISESPFSLQEAVAGLLPFAGHGG